MFTPADPQLPSPPHIAGGQPTVAHLQEMVVYLGKLNGELRRLLQDVYKDLRQGRANHTVYGSGTSCSANDLDVGQITALSAGHSALLIRLSDTLYSCALTT